MVAAHETALIKSGIFSPLAPYLEELGVSVDDVTADAKLPKYAEWGASEMVPLADAADLMEAAARVTRDRDFGLNFSAHVPPGVSGVLGQAQASSPTVLGLIEATKNYSPIAIAASTVQWHVEPTGGLLVPALPQQFGPVRRQLTDFLMALLIDRIRIGAGHVWYPRAISLMTSRPLDDRMTRNVFGPRVTFSARQFSIFVENEVLERPLPQAIVGLYETILPIAEEQLREAQKSTSVVFVVRSVIMELLAAHETVSLEPVARRLNLSVRALQWRIEREDENFESIFFELRKELADGYLLDESRTMSEISQLLGFSEPSAFARWMRKSMEMSPTQRRAFLLEQEAKAGS